MLCDILWNLLKPSQNTDAMYLTKLIVTSNELKILSQQPDIMTTTRMYANVCEKKKRERNIGCPVRGGKSHTDCWHFFSFLIHTVTDRQGRLSLNVIRYNISRIFTLRRNLCQEKKRFGQGIAKGEMVRCIANEPHWKAVLHGKQFVCKRLKYS